MELVNFFPVLVFCGCKLNDPVIVMIISCRFNIYNNVALKNFCEAFSAWELLLGIWLHFCQIIAMYCVKAVCQFDYSPAVRTVANDRARLGSSPLAIYDHDRAELLAFFGDQSPKPEVRQLIF